MKIASHKFGYDNSALCLGRLLPIEYGEGGMIPNKSVIALGYCNAEDLSFRPRKNEYAIMFQEIKEWDEDFSDNNIERDLETFWIHVTLEQLRVYFPNAER
jgi:hypothetical protein